MNIFNFFKINILNKEERLKVKQISNKRPLIHFITNYVTANVCANVVLKIGGSPVMADEESEMEEISNMSNAVVLNIGTINERTLKSMLVAGKKANEEHKVIVFDPCGVGASEFREIATKKLLSNIKMSVIKGNFVEIAKIASFYISKLTFNKVEKQKGVDGDAGKISDNDIIAYAKIVAKNCNCICCVSGKIDIITDGKNVLYCRYGNKIMTKITGCGCMLNGIIACCCSVDKNYLLSTYNACCIFGKKYKYFLGL